VRTIHPKSYPYSDKGRAKSSMTSSITMGIICHLIYSLLMAIRQVRWFFISIADLTIPILQFWAVSCVSFVVKTRPHSICYKLSTKMSYITGSIREHAICKTYEASPLSFHPSAGATPTDDLYRDWGFGKAQLQQERSPSHVGSRELTRVCPGYCKVLIAARELPLALQN